MGFLDELVGSLGNGNGSGNGQGNLLTQLGPILQWVEEQGGFGVLMQKFQQGGLGEVLGSWIGNGSNAAIGGGEIQSAFDQSQLQSLADKLGTDVNGASGTLAALLPQLFDRMSPQGEIDQQAVNSNSQDLGAMVDQMLKR